MTFERHVSRLALGISLLPVLLVGAGCGRLKDGGSTDDTGTLSAALTGAGSVSDISGLHYEILPPGTACGGAAIDEKTVQLVDQNLPTRLGPSGTGDMHQFGDGLFTLPAGPYHVCVTPLGLDGNPSGRCHVASGDATVVAETTTEVLLVSMCDGNPTGALDTAVALNSPPSITDIAIDPSKFLDQCQQATVSVTASDPDGDAITYAWSVVSGPAGAVLTPATNTATFQSDVVGDYEVKVVVTDVFGAAASLTFPVHVSAGGDFCPVACQVSDWSDWSTCSAVCGGGTQTRTRTVTVAPLRGGATCPALDDSQACNQQACTEIAFVVDTSGSIGPAAHDQLVTAMSTVLADPSLLPQDGSVSVGLIEFATAVTTVVPLTTVTPSTIDGLISGVHDLAPSAGITNTKGAVQAAIAMFEGMGQPGANKLEVVITDGIPDPPTTADPCPEAPTLHADGITTHILGVGPEWMPGPVMCLVANASDIISVPAYATIQAELKAELMRALHP